MASQLLLAEQRLTLDAINRLAIRDLNDVWSQLDIGDARVATDELLSVVPTLTTVYGEMAATLSADIYDEVRAEAGVRGRFTAAPANPVPTSQAEALVRWGVSPIWSASPNPTAALDRLSGGLTRLALRPAGDTVVNAVKDDPADPRYARTTHGGACHFCLMLAARGAKYHGDAPYFESHDHCRCSAVQVYDGQDIPSDNQRLSDEWQKVTDGRSNDEARAAWREHVESMTSAERGSLIGPLLPA